jgi:hypothetical protein
MLAWLYDARRKLTDAAAPFGLILDLRTLAPLAPAAQRVFNRGLQLFQEKGLRRSAVIVLDATIKADFTRLAKESGIYRWERYISAESTRDWQARALAWVSEGIDPDGATDEMESAPSTHVGN